MQLTNSRRGFHSFHPLHRKGLDHRLFSADLGFCHCIRLYRRAVYEWITERGYPIHADTRSITGTRHPRAADKKNFEQFSRVAINVEIKNFHSGNAGRHVIRIASGQLRDSRLVSEHP
jgi:hypothetical protein